MYLFWGYYLILTNESINLPLLSYNKLAAKTLIRDFNLFFFLRKRLENVKHFIYFFKRLISFVVYTFYYFFKIIDQLVVVDF